MNPKDFTLNERAAAFSDAAVYWKWNIVLQLKFFLKFLLFGIAISDKKRMCFGALVWWAIFYVTAWILREISLRTVHSFVCGAIWSSMVKEPEHLVSVIEVQRCGRRENQRKNLSNIVSGTSILSFTHLPVPLPTHPTTYLPTGHLLTHPSIIQMPRAHKFLPLFQELGT